VILAAHPAVHQTAPCFGALTALCLRSNGLGGGGARALAGSFGGLAVLEELDLADNEIDGESAAQLLRALPSSGARLRLLDLSSNALEELGLREQGLEFCSGAECVCAALRPLKRLEELQVGMSGLGDAGVALLAEMLGALPAFRVLGAKSNGLSDGGERAVRGSALGSTGTLDVSAFDGRLSWSADALPAAAAAAASTAASTAAPAAGF